MLLIDVVADGPLCDGVWRSSFLFQFPFGTDEWRIIKCFVLWRICQWNFIGVWWIVFLLLLFTWDFLSATTHWRFHSLCISFQTTRHVWGVNITWTTWELKHAVYNTERIFRECYLFWFYFLLFFYFTIFFLVVE